jgi:two-component system, OmpR family, KDP operon response regulator KdpE
MAKILIVDDSPVMTKLLGGMLGAKNYDVAVASDAISAVGVAQREKPDLIILDLGLPGGDGFLLMRRFKNLARLALTPVIVLSGEGSASIKEKALQAGAEAFFTKPPNEEELLSAIQQRVKQGPSG